MIYTPREIERGREKFYNTITIIIGNIHSSDVLLHKQCLNVNILTYKCKSPSVPTLFTHWRRTQRGCIHPKFTCYYIIHHECCTLLLLCPWRKLFRPLFCCNNTKCNNNLIPMIGGRYPNTIPLNYSFS